MLENVPNVSKRRSPLWIAASLILLFALAGVLLYFFGWPANGQLYLDDSISVCVTHADGSETHYLSNRFSPVGPGDSVDISIALPARPYADAALCFCLPNSVLEVYSGDTLLYSYGQALADAGRQIGNMWYRVPIPENAWGTTLHLHCRPMENAAFSKVWRVMILPSVDSLRYPLIGHEISAMVMFTMLGLFTGALWVQLFSLHWSSLRRQGVYMALFGAVISAWALGFDGLFFLFFRSPALCANLEYFLLFLMPVPLCLYLFEASKIKWCRTLYGGMAAGFGVFFLAATALNFTTAAYHYSRLLPVLHLSLGCAMAVLIVCLFSTRNSGRDDLETDRGRILTAGLVLSMAAFTLELIRYNLDKFLPNLSQLFSGSIAFVGIGIFALTLTMHYALQWIEDFQGHRERESLQRMALFDALTCIYNRSGCLWALSEMEKQGQQRFTIFFFDVNNLKKANDTYGHEMGDRLLQFVADNLRETFLGHGHYGRWGGDEFVAFIEGDETARRTELCTTFAEHIDAANRAGLFPFPISVACGVTSSTAAHPIPVFDAIKAADHQMYAEKQRFKDRAAEPPVPPL